MPKPLEYPDFAMDDIVDPVSGQNNVIAPTFGKMSSGWGRFEIPPRQTMNWIHRISAQWVRWLEEITDSNELRLDDVETLLATATSLATANTLVIRDASGRFRAADPSNSSDVTTRGWILNRIFESGVRLPFYQSAAPAGWTAVSGLNDRALMSVNVGSGGVIGGSGWTISGLSVGLTVLTLSNLPTGSYLIRNIGGPFPGPVSRDTGSGFSIDDGSGIGHAHSLSSTGTWRPAYAAVTICQKNAL